MKHFPITRLAARYNEMQKDGRLLSLRDSISVVRERIGILLERIQQNEFPDRMENLQKLWKKFRDVEAIDPLEAVKVKNQIDQEFEAAYHDYMAWKQVFEAVDLDRKLVESEVKVAKDLQAILTAEDAYNLTAKLFAALMGAVNQQANLPPGVKSKILNRVEHEFTKIIGDGQSPDATDEGSEEELVGSVGEVIDA